MEIVCIGDVIVLFGFAAGYIGFFFITLSYAFREEKAGRTVLNVIGTIAHLIGIFLVGGIGTVIARQ